MHADAGRSGHPPYLACIRASTWAPRYTFAHQERKKERKTGDHATMHTHNMLGESRRAFTSSAKLGSIHGVEHRPDSHKWHAKIRWFAAGCWSTGFCPLQWNAPWKQRPDLVSELFDVARVLRVVLADLSDASVEADARTSFSAHFGNSMRQHTSLTATWHHFFSFSDC